MKTYQITYWQTIYETVEVEAKDEDEAMEIFNDWDSKIISSKIKTEDIDEVKDSKTTNVTNNSLFVGSTSDLQKMLKDTMKKNK